MERSTSSELSGDWRRDDLGTDFAKDVSGGDPAVFHNQCIVFALRVTKGNMRFHWGERFYFGFHRKDEDGRINWRDPFATIDAVTDAKDAPRHYREDAGAAEEKF